MHLFLYPAVLPCYKIDSPVTESTRALDFDRVDDLRRSAQLIHPTTARNFEFDAVHADRMDTRNHLEMMATVAYPIRNRPHRHYFVHHCPIAAGDGVVPDR